MKAPANTQIRKFRTADADSVKRLIHDTFDISYLSVYPQQAINFFKGFHSVEKIIDRARQGHTLVMEKDGEIIGTGSFFNGEILGVFVKPARQHQGCGKSLMLALERIAVSENHSKVTLSVSLPARRFYENLGYSVIKECAIVVKNGKHLAYWKASKMLRKRPELQADRDACLPPPDRCPGPAL